MPTIEPVVLAHARRIRRSAGPAAVVAAHIADRAARRRIATHRTNRSGDQSVSRAYSVTLEEPDT
jgi:hypothetical protein